MLELFSLLFLASESTQDAIVQAPEVLELEQIQKWLAGSVWALVGLNLLALILFLSAMTAPQLKKLKSALSAGWKTLRTKKEKLKVERVEPPAPTAATPAPVAAAPTPEPVPVPVPAPPPPPIEEPTLEAEAAPVEEAPVEEPPPPPPELEPVPEGGFGNEKTEVLEEAPAVMEPETQKIESKKDSDDADFIPPPPDKTEILVKEDVTSQAPDDTQTLELPEELSPLPTPPPSGENTSTKMPANDFDKSLNDLLESSPDQTEELPIFDTQAIEESLKKAVEEIDAPSSKGNS